jgi:Outer membrane protein beta-barrel domain
MQFTLALLACLIFPGWAAAQSPLPQNEAAVSIGWSGSEHHLEEYDRWHGNLFLSGAGGRYWTDHLKTELEAGWQSRTNSESYDQVIIDGVHTYAISNHRVRDLRLSISQSYQFGRNQWVHPYVGVGADIIHRQSVLDRPTQSRPQTVSSAGRPFINVTIPARHDSETRVLVRPFLRSGVKMYASEEVFFLTELKLGFAPDLDHALWKVGFGFDF